MKNYSFFSWLLVLPLFISIVSCDHRDVAPRFRVKTIAYSVVAGGKHTFTLTYDSTGRLIRHIFRPWSAGAIFAADGKFINYTETALGVNGMDDKINTYTQYYYYDSMKRVAKTNYFWSLNINRSLVTNDFTYNGTSTVPASKLITRGERYDPFAKTTRPETYVFTGGNATTIDGVNYTYDNTPNPYRGLFGFSAFNEIAPDFERPLNRPFKISERFSDTSVKVFNQNNRTNDAQLTYNSDGLVTKIAYNDGEIEEFTYESY